MRSQQQIRDDIRRNREEHTALMRELHEVATRGWVLISTKDGHRFEIGRLVEGYPVEAFDLYVSYHELVDSAVVRLGWDTHWIRKGESVEHGNWVVARFATKDEAYAAQKKLFSASG